MPREVISTPEDADALIEVFDEFSPTCGRRAA